MSHQRQELADRNIDQQKFPISLKLDDQMLSIIAISKVEKKTFSLLIV